MVDVLIIGGGVVGCCIARELSRGARSIAVLEKASDICEGTSKANSGIVHAGHDAVPGTLKAAFNTVGSRMMKALARELDFPYQNNGTLVLSFDEKNREGLEALLVRGLKNGVEGLSILSGEEVRAMEPAVSEKVTGGLYAPSGGIVCPFGLTAAMAENAAANGVVFHFNTKVTQIRRQNKGYLVETDQGSFEGRVVINAAGVYADEIHNMVCKDKIKIKPRRGEYLLFDKKCGKTVAHTLFQLPTAYGKGVLVTPTVHGNLLLGPTAEDIEDKEGVNTTAGGLDEILLKAAVSIRDIPRSDVITSFAGLRAAADGGDFIVGQAEDAPGFVDAAGIDSPGLTCAPAIGTYVAELVQEILPAPPRKDFIRVRKAIPNIAEASLSEKQELIAGNPAFAEVVCRCETITRGEIQEAVRRQPGAVTADGVKRRTRAGMGRCQSGFCGPRVVEIIAEELGIDPTQVTKSGQGSEFLNGEAGS